MVAWWQRMCVMYPWQIVGVSVLLLLGLGWYGSGLFTQLHDSGTSMYAQNSKAVQASKKIDEIFGSSPDAQVLLFERKNAALGTADSAEFAQEIHRLIEPLKNSGAKIKPIGQKGETMAVSKDKSAAFITLNMEGKDADIYKKLDEFAKTADQSNVAISIGGAAASEEQTTNVVASDLAKTEIITLPILLILLFLFFRSGVAALVPVAISVVTIIGAFAVARFAMLFTTIDTYAVNVITILGVGLSIDYALLSVNRFREELAKTDVNKAVVTIIATSGRTIFFSAITVVACLLVLMVFPIEFLHSIAIGSAAAVLVAMAFTVVVLPAILKVLGRHIDRLHLPVKRAHHDSRFWTWAAHATTAHPVLSVLFAFGVIAVAALPLLQFKTIGGMDYNWIARGSSAQHVAQKMHSDFAKNPQMLTAMQLLPAPLPEDQRLALSCQITDKLRGIKGVKQVGSATPTSAELPCDMLKQLRANSMVPPQITEQIAAYTKDTALKYDIVLEDDADTSGAKNTMLAVRDMSLTKGEWYVAGFEAKAYDMERAYIDSIPLALTIIGIGMIVLLSLLLRSLVIPVQAIVANAISLGISVGLLVGVFQMGWFKNLTGWGTTGGFVLAAPVLVVSIAFGLAMDYSVFLYSRMRETYDTTGDPIKAIRLGMIKTGPIITAAALALFTVVIAFAFSSVMFMQIIGLGLGVAVLVDAFFVRLILVPSLMALMGKASWYAPKWLTRWQIRHE